MFTTVDILCFNLMSTTVDILCFIRNRIIPDNQLLKSKCAFNLETLIYFGT